jgi:CDP-glucose 4,6-dehydratase
MEGMEMSNSFWSDRKVFVTGATGLVGACLVNELLARGARVIALIRDASPQSELIRSRDIERIDVVNGCVEDYSTLERAISELEAEVVFHLAAQPLVGVAYRSPLLTFESNIHGTYNLLEACRVHAGLVRRVVVASSDKAYGANPDLPYTEDMPLQGRYPYEVSKSCADLLAQCYFHTYGLPVTVARCGNIYGGGDLNWSRLIPGTIRSFLLRQAPIIRTDGSYVRDFIYLKDVARAYLLLAERLDDPSIQGQAFNFSPELPHNVLEMVALLQKLMDCEDIQPDIRHEARGEIHDQYLSFQKARRMLGWQPQFNMEESLKETIAWYRQYLGV